MAHRIAWALHYGRWPNGVIDHIDRNPGNNRIVNLRECSHPENIRSGDHHRSRRSKHGRGVQQLPSGRFRASVKSKGKRYHLGVFDTAEEARDARGSWERSNWGDYCAPKTAR